MTAIALPIPRERVHGVRQIVAFNWPFYAGGSLLVVVTLTALSAWTLPLPLRVIAWSSCALAVWWMAASLLVSWIVYDRSPLMRGSWLGLALPDAPARWIGIHAGVDELTPIVRATFPGTAGRTFDIFDPETMTEPSIARARQRRHAPAGETATAGALPVADRSIDAALLLLAAHELRTPARRAALFADVHRALAPDGRVVVVEHLRDAANFAAFGPGFLHFHSRRSWLRDFERAGLALRNERPITPFVRLFVLEKAS